MTPEQAIKELTDAGIAKNAPTADVIYQFLCDVHQNGMVTGIKIERLRCAKIAERMAIPGHAVQAPSCQEIARLIGEGK